MSEKQSDIAMVLEHLVELDGPEGPELLGSQCSKGEHYHYPATELCTHCGGDTTPVSLGGAGTIYSFTTVRVKPPLGLPRPYSVAYIDLEQVPLRIFGLLGPDAEQAFNIGQAVQLQVAEIGVNNQGEPCLRPYFNTCSAS